jgi:pyrroloquinoline quinone biosynthesis protein B
VKIVILRGGSAASRRRPTAGPASTRERGVTAIGDGQGRWVLVNMSPGVAHQLDSDDQLELHAGLPDADVRSVLLTDAQVDHVGGLLSLRDGAPIDLYATPAVFEALTTSLPVLPVLQHYCGVHWRVVPVAGDRLQADFRIDGMDQLVFTAVATRGTTPPHLDRAAHDVVGDSIALAVHDLGTGQRALFAPGLATLEPKVIDWMAAADCLLVDSPARPAAAVPPSAEPDPDDWFARLRALPARHKVLFGAASAAAALAGVPELAGAGIALAYDGMAIEL